MGNRNRAIAKRTAEVTTNLYELNKINMAQIPPVDFDWLKEKVKEVSDKIIDSGCRYYMLLNRERYDITVFHFGLENDIPFKKKHLPEELLACLVNRGFIIDFTDREDGSYEIWIRDMETQENFAYYLFDYTQGVINC